MRVLVTGGRGAIARAAVGRLEAGGLEVRVGGREPEAIDHPEAVLVDLTRPETFAPALDGVDRVLLYASPEGVDEFVAAARRAGVEQIVVVSSASVLEPGSNPIADRHRRVEDAVRASGLAWTFLRPGGFAGNTSWFVGPILTDGVIRLPYPDFAEAPIDERDIGDVAARVLLDGPGAGHDGTAPYLTGPSSMTRREEVEQLAAALGRPVEVVGLTGADARAEMAATMPPFVVDSLVGYWSAAQPGPAEVSAEGPRITGQPGRSFATWAAQVAAA